jgi:peptide deformylase
MTPRPLHLLGSRPLRERSSEVAAVDEEMRGFIDDLFETMDAAKGVGLAANQVGVATRIAVVDADGHRFAMINPVIVEQEGQDTAEEGCLSIPDLYADVTRSTRVILEALDRDGCPFRLEAEGLEARVIQHEIDHLDGILFVDRLSPLKRKLLVRRWRKSRKGAGHIQEIAASDTKA